MHIILELREKDGKISSQASINWSDVAFIPFHKGDLIQRQQRVYEVTDLVWNMPENLEAESISYVVQATRLDD